MPALRSLLPFAAFTVAAACSSGLDASGLDASGLDATVQVQSPVPKSNPSEVPVIDPATKSVETATFAVG